MHYLSAWVRRRPHLLPSVLAAVMLLAARGWCPSDLAYLLDIDPLDVGSVDFLTLLRFVVCAAAVFVVVQSVIGRQMWGIWIFGIVAVLFNPLLPIHLSRDVWRVLDVAAAITFAAGGLFLRITTPTRTTEELPTRERRR